MTPQSAILDYFKQGGTLTVVECREKFHTTELRRIVSRLKQAGENISGDFVDGENGERYKRYRIAQKPQQLELNFI